MFKKNKKTFKRWHKLGVLDTDDLKSNLEDIDVLLKEQQEKEQTKINKVTPKIKSFNFKPD